MAVDQEGYTALKQSRRPVVAFARDMPAMDLPRVAATALHEADDIVAMVMVQEAARRIGQADPADWGRDARRIAADMQWNGGEPGPLFEQSQERLGLLSTDGRMLFVGGHALRFLARDASDLIGRSIFDVFPEVASRMEPLLKRAVSGGIAKGGGWFEAAGKRSHASYLFVPVWRGGRVVAVLVLGTDTTDSPVSAADEGPALKM